MPQLDITTFSSQVFWLLITFTAMFLVMWRISVPKISDALEARQKKIDDNLARAEELRAEAELSLAVYEESLTKAHSNAQNIVFEANASLLKETQRRETELAETMKAQIAESEAKIDAAVNEAFTKIAGIAEEVAVSAIKRLTGDEPDAKDTHAAVKKAIKTIAYRNPI
jgi:F-type H+-transporting ATPase subunit b